MRLCALFVVLAAVLSAPAWGAVTEYICWRNLEIQGLIAKDGAPPGGDSASFLRKMTLTPNLFQQACSDSVGVPGVAAVGAMASQFSSLNIGPNADFKGASFAGSTSAAGSASNLWGANSHAISEFCFSFTADQPFTYYLDYACSTLSLLPPQASGRAAIKLTDSSGTALIDVGSGGAAVAGHLTGTLAPGKYTLMALCDSAGITAPMPGLPSFSAASSLTYTLNLQHMPEPATLALLALGGCLIRRRRR
jgi:hypothetical protein